MSATALAARVIRDAAFARRLEQACDGNPHAPPLHRGRLVWLQSELQKRFHEKVSVETCRKWFAGEAKPRPDKMSKIAQLLQVDVIWLSMGVDPELSPRERKARNAMVDGVVNVVAGFIQMDGGHPAFPADDDKRAKQANIDIYAIIKGANYTFHIVLGEQSEQGLKFSIPTAHEDAVVLGIIRDGLSLRIYEIPGDVIEQVGAKRGGSIGIEVAENVLKKVDGFTRRL